jgi:hypothetical protein
MESISLCQGRLSPEQIEAFLTAQNERYRKEMVQFSDHHADDYEPYEGHPDGKDLFDAYVERTMHPTLDEQAETPEFKMAALSLHVTCLQQGIKALEMKLFKALENSEFHLGNRIDRLQESLTIQGEALVNHIYGCPDDYDTQQQVEELPADFWEREF